MGYKRRKRWFSPKLSTPSHFYMCIRFLISGLKACYQKNRWNHASKLQKEVGLACALISETSFPTLHRIMTVLNLTFIELREVSIEHLRRVWHADRECVHFRIPASVPRCGICLYSTCWDQISRTCCVFTRLFSLNTPRYFLEFV